MPTKEDLLCSVFPIAAAEGIFLSTMKRGDGDN
jgi:hypothetical protein